MKMTTETELFTVAQANELYTTAVDCLGESESMMIAAVKAAIDCGHALNNLKDGCDEIFIGGMEVAEKWQALAANHHRISAGNVGMVYLEMMGYLDGEPSEPRATGPHIPVLGSTPHDSADIDGGADIIEQATRSEGDGDQGTRVADKDGKNTPRSAAAVLSAAPVAGEPRVWRVRVRGRAIGIPAAELDTLPWHQAHAAAYEARRSMVALKKRINALCVARETAPIGQGKQFVDLMRAVDEADRQLKFEAPAYKCPYIVPAGRVCAVCRDRGWITEEQYLGLPPEGKELVKL